MDHFDNCAMFEEGFGRAMVAHERRAGHFRRLPPSSFGFYGGQTPTVVGLTLTVLREVARHGEIEIDRARKPLAMMGSADITTQISSLVTRGLVRSEFTDATRRLTITDLGRQSLAMSR